MNRTAAVIFLGLALSALAVAQRNTKSLPTLTSTAPNPPAIVIQPPVAPLPVTVPQVPTAAQPAAQQELTALVWDSDKKEYDAQPGDATAPYVFLFTNTSSREVVISKLQTSCGCT